VSERRSVAIQIFGHEYRIKTDADPAGVERLARLVDDTMARIREKTGAVDTLDLAVMAALNLANDLLAAQAREREQTGYQVPARELAALRERIEGVLAGPTASA
jgi:cell division protein ZapA